MNKMLRMGAIGAVIVASFGGASMANAAATADATATARILETLTLSVQTGSQLNFGQIAVNGAGDVTVSPSGGSAVCTANLICTGTTSAVAFDVQGSSGASVAVTFPSTSVNLTSGTNTMALTNFTSSAPSVTLSALGAGTFSVGGKLSVAAGQAAGTYTGTFPVKVEYN